MNTTTHNLRCIDNAQVTVRDECAELLTAPAWDDAALQKEIAWVEAVAAEWLRDGTKDCTCDGSVEVSS